MSHTTVEAQSIGICVVTPAQVERHLARRLAGAKAEGSTSNARAIEGLVDQLAHDPPSSGDDFYIAEVLIRTRTQSQRRRRFVAPMTEEQTAQALGVILDQQRKWLAEQESRK